MTIKPSIACCTIRNRSDLSPVTTPISRPESSELVNEGVRHIVVYDQSGVSAMWPANNGIWQWGYEVVVVFTAASFSPVESGPAVDATRPCELWQARSTDGGEHWTIEKPPSLGTGASTDNEMSRLSSPLNLLHPGFAMLFKFRDQHDGPSGFFVSIDRCRTWSGPFRFEVFGIDRIATRTDYIVQGPGECIMFGSAAKSNGKEGRTFCAQTLDGGRTWDLVAHIGPEPNGYIIMPSTVSLDSAGYLTALRHKEDDLPCSIDIFAGDQNALKWTLIGKAAADIGPGNPPNLLRLADQRLVVVYGFRAMPFGIRARISVDNGLSWSDEIVLRDDGFKPDLGYSKSIVRPDGKILSVYYFNGPRDDRRTIEATIWEP